MADFLLLLDSPFISLMHLQQNWDYGTGLKYFKTLHVMILMRHQEIEFEFRSPKNTLLRIFKNCVGRCFSVVGLDFVPRNGVNTLRMPLFKLNQLCYNILPRIYNFASVRGETRY